MSVAGRALTGLAGVLGFPLAWLVVQQGFATGWVAVVLLVLYEVVVLLGAIVASVAQQVVRRRVEQILDFFDLALGRRVSRYARYYRRYVLERDRHINARDLAHTPSHIPELDAVYVDVGLAPGSPSGRAGGLLPRSLASPTQRQSIHEFLDQERPAVCAVIGAPGSGKSTLLRHTARLAASQGKERRRRVPVMLALRDHADALTEDPSRTLAQLIRDDVGTLAVAEPGGWWEAQLRNGDCLILLDGLDEIARSEHRAAIAEWIEHQIAKHPKNDFVITSRPHGYQTAVIPQATVLQVRPFTTQQIRQFVHGWCRAAERLATGAVGPEIDQRANEEAEDLIGQLASAPALTELAVNPLLLTMMVLVHRERRSLPAGRADLYSQVCDVMLWRRLESKKLEVKPPGAVRQRILAALAYDMMVAETRDYPKAQVLEVFDRALQQLDADISAEDLLTALVETSGLLVERERDLYAFAHHTIGEYLASTHIRSKNLSATLIRSVGDPWWRETTLLFVTDTDADEIVKACFRKNTGSALALAYDCVRSHGQLDPELRAGLDLFRQGAFEEDGSPEHRRLVASALASGHLTNLVTTAGGALICDRPIPEDLYWLFCKETGTPLPDGTSELGPNPTSAAFGMRRSDAESFVAWLNGLDVQGSDVVYRLPTGTEIEFLTRTKPKRDQSPRHYDSAWTARTNNKTYSRPWSADRTNPFAVSGGETVTAATNDLSHTSTLFDSIVTALRLDAGGLCHVFENARTLDYEGSKDTDARAGFGLASKVAHNTERARSLALDSDRTFDVRVELDYEFISRCALGLARIERHSSNLPFLRKLAHQIEQALSSSAAIASGFRYSEHFSYINSRTSILEKSLGRAVTLNLTGTLAHTQALFAHSGIQESAVESVDLDSLMEKLLVACTAVGGHDVEERKQTWAASVAWRLVNTAEPVLTRAQRPTPAVLANIRVPALLLAAETQLEGEIPVASAFRTVAAGVTLIERRLSGEASLETILLARE